MPSEVLNGASWVNGDGNRHPSHLMNNLSLTEYSSGSPPHKDKSSCQDVVPTDFLLPNGYPDVSRAASWAANGVDNLQYLRLILTSRVYEVVKETPITHATNLSNRLECQVLLKREDLQPVFSFKLRGAYNKMAHLDPATSWKGVVACSAGNHAQGVAYSARKLKIAATIVMPEGTPSIKHLNVSRLGGSVVLHGQDFEGAKEECLRLQKLHGLTNIPPFDDPYVIAGQGTIGMELLRQTDVHKLEAIFCCVGGGGLIAGVGVYVKRIAPHVKIIAVEAQDANALSQSLAAGRRVTLPHVGLFADGAAVKTVGEETFRLCREVVDEVIELTTDEICASIKDVFEDTRSIVEPAGALAVAGLKKYAAANPSANTSRQLLAIASGANMNFDRLRFVAERASLGEQREALLRVSLPERPGAFGELVTAVLPHAVTEFSYRYAGPTVAHVLLGISLTAPASQRAAELTALLGRVHASGSMRALDLSGDELAKSHVRYLGGGRSAVAHERLYMFTFPERPGALHHFLDRLPRYNISLFQYRNAGADVGRVLAGIVCPEPERARLESFLCQVGYPWEECTDSDVYRIFLREDESGPEAVDVDPAAKGNGQPANEQ
jgi:threonine dehydratase